MPTNKKKVIDEQTGVSFELVDETPIDQVFAVVSIVYLFLAMAFFLWQLFDVWIGHYMLARLVQYPNLQLLDDPAFHLAVYAFIGGALGGIVNGIRSFLVWHADRFAFGHRFVWKYIAAPWLGGALGLFTYALIQGGIAVFGGSGSVGTSDPSQVLATFSVGVLAGYGSQKVFVWLDAQVVRIFQVSSNKVVVPPLIDLTRDKAEAALQKAGLVLGEVKEEDQTVEAKIGKVIKQVPAQDTTADSGSTVDITIGRSPTE